MRQVVLKIENLENTNPECIPVLNRLFHNFGIKPLHPKKTMEYWSVMAEGKKHFLLNEPILAIDESGNQLRAVFFVTRKLKGKKTELFRFTELFEGLHTTEKTTTIKEAVERFILEKTEYKAPISVLCLGKMEEEGKQYSGCFIYNVPRVKSSIPVVSAEKVPGLEVKKIEKLKETGKI